MFCETRPNRALRRSETRADDFATIWAGMEELRREREGAQTVESDLHEGASTHRARTARRQPSEMDARLWRVRQPGAGRG
jgi:hypothetical protein